MLISCLTCNDIIPQKLGTNVMSAVITGLICTIREVAMRYRQALPGNTTGPTKAVVESCCDNTLFKEVEIKALPQPWIQA